MIAKQIIAISAFLSATALAIPMPGNLARDVKSDLVLLDRGIQAGANPAHNDINVPVGEALDLSYRFGFFSLSVRVAPRDDPGKWLIREPTTTVFQPQTVQTKLNQGPNNFESKFQIFFCDDVEELQEAFFRDFTAEGIEQPHKLYTGSWHANTKAKYLGLDKEVFNGEYSFVLAKLRRVEASVSVMNNPSLKPDAQQAINSIRVGDRDSVLDWVQNYGSHYVKDVVVGDMIYQVIALTPEQYGNAKANLNGQRHFNSAAEFGSFYARHLAPWLVKQSGKVMAASGDFRMSTFLERELIEEGQFGRYPSIFKLLEDSSKANRLSELAASSTSAVIGLNFASLRPWIVDIQAKEYYDEVAGTQASLWEVNL